MVDYQEFYCNDPDLMRALSSGFGMLMNLMEEILLHPGI